MNSVNSVNIVNNVQFNSFYRAATLIFDAFEVHILTFFLLSFDDDADSNSEINIAIDGCKVI